MSETVLHAPLELREVNREKRQATFVASTERAVETWSGPEVLRMSGARLQRYRKNPVLLDSHDRSGLASVIGKADVTIKGRELQAVATYAQTPSGEMAWQLVDGGFVRAMSIGYLVNRKKTKFLREGETDGEGEGLVTGPAAIVREWELIEVSNVPVPADEDAVRRAFYGAKENHMAQNENSGGRSINFSLALADAGEPTPAKPEGTPAPKPPAAPARASADELPEARAVHLGELKRRAVLSFTPPGLEDVAHAGLLDGLEVDAIRSKLKEAQAARFKPVGTPEPKPTEKPEAEAERAKPMPEWVTDDVLIRSFENLR